MGFPVGQINSSALGGITASEILGACSSLGLRLAYVVLPWGDAFLREKARDLGAILVDQKVHYFSGIESKRISMPSEVVPFDGIVPCRELESLALASGIFSRFHTDPQIAESIFQDLYLTWIRRSVRGEIADVVLVAKKNGAIAGMVTVGLRGDHAEIGLLAVAEGCRGQGFGRLLIDGAETWAVSRGVHAMTVATQGANAAARALYAGSGYEVAQMQAIYHLWMESPLESRS